MVKNSTNGPQDHRDHQEIDHGRKYGCLHFPYLSRSQKLGDDHRAPDSAADGNGDEHIGDGVGRAHGRQGIFPDEAAHDHRVCDIVKLLEQVAEDHGEGKK